MDPIIQKQIISIIIPLAVCLLTLIGSIIVLIKGFSFDRKLKGIQEKIDINSSHKISLNERKLNAISDFFDSLIEFYFSTLVYEESNNDQDGDLYGSDDILGISLKCRLSLGKIALLGLNKDIEKTYYSYEGIILKKNIEIKKLINNRRDIVARYKEIILLGESNETPELKEELKRLYNEKDSLDLGIKDKRISFANEIAPLYEDMELELKQEYLSIIKLE